MCVWSTGIWGFPAWSLENLDSEVTPQLIGNISVFWPFNVLKHKRSATQHPFFKGLVSESEGITNMLGKTLICMNERFSRSTRDTLRVL